MSAGSSDAPRRHAIRSLQRLAGRSLAAFSAGTLLLPIPMASLGLDPQVLEIGIHVVFIILSLSVHEAAHAWAALRCGDTTARDQGRLTLNPIVHIDLWMTILLPAMLLFASNGQFAFGGAKPVPVSFHRLRHPWRDMSFVAIAGPASNFVLAVLFLLLCKLMVMHGWYNGASDSVSERFSNDLLPRVLFGAAWTNVYLAIFNLFPIPPLDGSRVLAWLLPDRLRESYVDLGRWGMFLVFGLLCLPQSPLRPFLASSGMGVLRWMLRLIHFPAVW